MNPAPTTTKRAPPKLTTSEIIALNNEVTNVASGKKYLERTALTTKGRPYTLDAISEILLHTTQLTGVSLPVQTAIRAIAFILEEKTINETADVIALQVTAAISPHIARLQDTEKKLTKQTDEISTSSNIQTARIENIQTSIDKLATQIKETASLKPTYAAALTAGNQPDPELRGQHSQILAREAIKERQILIDFPSSSQLATGKSSHAQLVERVKKALTSLPRNENTPEMETRTIMQFRQGGMVIEFMTKEAADHLRTDANAKEKFLQNLDTNATLKERSYLVVVPFMPLYFKPSENTNLRQMGLENGWNKGTVLTARWIKPVEKRKSTQTVAHILITFADPSTANMAIQSGITVDQLKLWPKKNRREPLRCAKCQCYGHIAKECIAHGDTCANCGNNHHTSDCTMKDKKYCTACETEEHASWECDCPAFIKKCEDTDKRYPDNTMPYFLMHEEWTQVTAPARPPPYRKPPQIETTQRQTSVQQRLDAYPMRAPEHGTARGDRHPSRGFIPNRSPPRPTGSLEPYEHRATLFDYQEAGPQDISGWDA